FCDALRDLRRVQFGPPDSLLDVHRGGVESEDGEPGVGQPLGMGRGLPVEIVEGGEENPGLLLALVEYAGPGGQLLLERRELGDYPFEWHQRRGVGLLLLLLGLLLLLVRLLLLLARFLWLRRPRGGAPPPGRGVRPPLLS